MGEHGQFAPQQKPSDRGRHAFGNGIVRKDDGDIYRVLSTHGERIAYFESQMQSIKQAANANLWDAKTRFYYDLNQDLSRIPAKTIALRHLNMVSKVFEKTGTIW